MCRLTIPSETIQTFAAHLGTLCVMIESCMCKATTGHHQTTAAQGALSESHTHVSRADAQMVGSTCQPLETPASQPKRNRIMGNNF